MDAMSPPGKVFHNRSGRSRPRRREGARHALGPSPMLSASIPLLGAAGAGLGALPTAAASTGLGLVGLAMAALFVALLGASVPGGTAEEEAQPDWTDGFGRRGAALCAAVFVAMGVLAAGLAWQVWGAIGPRWALGLAALSLGSLAAALAFGARALRRR